MAEDCRYESGLSCHHLLDPPNLHTGCSYVDAEIHSAPLQAGHAADSVRHEPFPRRVCVKHQMPRHIPGLLPRTNASSSLGMAEWRVVCKVLPPSAAHLLLLIFSRGRHQDTHFIGKETEAQRQESVPNPITTSWLRGASELIQAFTSLLQDRPLPLGQSLRLQPELSVENGSGLR